MGSPISIGPNRKLFAGAALLFGGLGVAMMVREFSAGSIGLALVIGVLFGAGFFYYARDLLRREPAIVIDDDGLGGYRVGHRIRWADISDVRVAQRQGAFGVYRRLILTIRHEDARPLEDSHGLLTSRMPTERIDVSLDQLAMPWAEIIAAVEARLGQRISTSKATLLSEARGE
jgi:hypothetical protein